MNLQKLKISYLGLFAICAVTFLLTSCEKNNLQENEISDKEQEINTELLRPDLVETNKPMKQILHLKLDGNLSIAEASERWNTYKAQYFEENNSNLNQKRTNDEVTFSVYTITGDNRSWYGTDGDVYCYIGFRTNATTFRYAFSELDNFGDDREPGDYDFYLFEFETGDIPISWIEIDNAWLALKGSDCWFVDDFKAYVSRHYQSENAWGYTEVEPNNINEYMCGSGNNFDWYYTNNIGVGRLNFY